MFKCYQCGFVAVTEKVRFCGNCGAANVDPESVDPLADKLKGWASEHIDQPKMVSQYVSMLAEFYFESPKSAEVMKYSVRIRERLKISFETHKTILEKLEAKKKEIAHLANFRFEFNENVVDAYAGHDTFLNFRYTNQTEDDLFKVALFWDDPDTERIDLKAETKSLVKPMTSVTLGVSAIFDRIGMKELSDFQITITDQFGEAATFRAEPFSFKVGNHDQRITQNISTHNQISIEGRGVVDASGMGSDKSATQTVASSQPRWRELNFSYVPTAQKAQETEVVALQPAQAKVEVFEPPKPVLGVFNKDDLLSVLKAAEQGNPDAQLTLGQMYAEGHGVAKDEEKAANWYHKAAEQGNARACEYIGDMYRFGNGVVQSHRKSVYWYRKGDELNDAGCQRSLGLCYEDGDGVDQNHEQAAHWYRKAAEHGDAVGQMLLGRMYREGLGVAKDNEQAVYWYRKAAEQGYPPGQNSLGLMYQEGLGVAEDNEQAVYWYRKAAEQGYPFGQNNLGYMYHEGLGVGKDKEKAVYWFRKAAEQGQESAIESLKNLESSDAPTQPPADGHGAWDYGNYSYTGMFKNGQWNGLGELTWSGNDLGHKYVGNFINGERTGQGTYYFPDGTTQVGMFENGIYQEPENQIDDTDTDEQIIYNDGSSYLGEVENGVPEGFGTMTFTNGDSMSGIFINGIMNDATAHYDFADGGSYDGPMFKTIFIGPGTRTFGGDYVGHSYTGEFENGNFNGQGTYFFPDGSTNVGEFKDGTFVPPKPAKPDYVYVGATSNGIPHGVGKMTWGNGDVYKGDFVNGVRHGLGEFTYANKTQLTGRFENDEFVKNASFAESFKIGYKTGDL